VSIEPTAIRRNKRFGVEIAGVYPGVYQWLVRGYPAQSLGGRSSRHLGCNHVITSVCPICSA